MAAQNMVLVDLLFWVLGDCQLSNEPSDKSSEKLEKNWPTPSNWTHINNSSTFLFQHIWNTVDVNWYMWEGWKIKKLETDKVEEGQFDQQSTTLKIAPRSKFSTPTSREGQFGQQSRLCQNLFEFSPPSAMRSQNAEAVRMWPSNWNYIMNILFSMFIQIQYIDCVWKYQGINENGLNHKMKYNINCLHHI